MNGGVSESDVDCNVCGTVDADGTVDVGTFRSESGSIGLSLCIDCWEAAEWHAKNTEQSRCFNCSEPESKELTISKPNEPNDKDGGGEALNLAMCRDCYREAGSLMHACESEIGFRAIANVRFEWDSQRHSALQRDDFSCQSCGISDCRLHVHHKVPRSAGGTDHLDNLVTLCPDCHADEHEQNACLLCGGLDDIIPATWLDTGGGNLCHFCNDCRDYIKRGGGGERCSICARFSKTRRSEGIYFQDGVKVGEKPTKCTACDECRKKIIFGMWDERQQYVDEELPNSHVDVRHWEGDS